jgi:UDP-glucuronate decarboxylase
LNPEDYEQILSAPLDWQQFAGKRILVTGANGFLPAYMIETLLSLNEKVLSSPVKVVALVRDEERGLKRFFAYKGRSDLEIMERDICLRLQADPWLLQPFDYVIHAAAQASPIFYKTDPAGTIMPNVIGTFHLLNRVRDFSPDCKGFLFFSSGEAAMPIDPLDPRSCYGESKRMGETMCVAWANQFRVPAKIARITHTYGPGMKLDDGRVFADFTRDILNGGPIVLHSDGLAKRCFCYLADATVAFFTVLLKGEVAQAYNVANPDAEVSIKELAERLARLFNLKIEQSERIVASTSKVYMPSNDQGTAPSIDKIAALGWKPTTGIEEGFERTVKSYE